MKATALKCTVFALFFLALGCGRGFYYSNDTNQGEIAFAMDSTTQVYTHKKYASSTAFEGRELSNKKADSMGNDGMLTEVQYLFFNGDKVLYISTVASRYIYDKTDTYLIRNPNRRSSYPNSFYFNSFYFGNYDSINGHLVFRNKKIMQKWNMASVVRNQINLLSIDNFKLKKVHFNNKDSVYENYTGTDNVGFSINEQIAFKKIHYFKFLSFKTPDSRTQALQKANDTTSKITYPKSNEIRVVYKNAQKKQIKYLFIPFNNQLIPDYKALKFNPKRIRYYHQN